MIVFVSSILFNIPRFFEWYLDSIPCMAGTKLYFRSPGSMQSEDNVVRKQVSVYLFICLSFYQSIFHPFVYLSVHLSMCLSVCFSKVPVCKVCFLLPSLLSVHLSFYSFFFVLSTFPYLIFPSFFPLFFLNFYYPKPHLANNSLCQHQNVQRVKIINVIVLS